MEHGAWRMANKRCLLLMKKTISEVVFGGVEETKSAKQFMESIERKIKESNKAEMKNLMSRLTNMKYE
ncbi:unnamed protein product [Prunus armeniaca]